MRFLYDTSIFVYAVGTEHPFREPCRAILRRNAEGGLAGEASIELVQEFAHVRLRRSGDRTEALELAGWVAQLCRLHAFEPADLPLAFSLLARHPQLQVRDAVMASTALNRGLTAILSTDRAFDQVDGLRRVDPADDAAVEALTA